MATQINPKMPNEDWRPPTEDEIRKRAYELYLERESHGNMALDDWLKAEAELWTKRSTSPDKVSTDRPSRRRAPRRKP
jgi:hypothetical protein